MICIAVNSKTSFDGINKWRDEIKEIEPDKDIMLILTKSDMAENNSLNPEELVTFESILTKKR